MSSVTICPLELADLSSISLLESTATPFPWSEKAHRDSIEQSYPSLSLKASGQLIGFIVFNYLADECHLLNIAIEPKEQGKGYAQLLIEAMIDKAQQAEMKKVILEVRAGNSPAINLYRKLRFEQIGIRKNYYRGNVKDSKVQESCREDAIVMQKAL